MLLLQVVSLSWKRDFIGWVWCEYVALWLVGDVFGAKPGLLLMCASLLLLYYYSTLLLSPPVVVVVVLTNNNSSNILCFLFIMVGGLCLVVWQAEHLYYVVDWSMMLHAEWHNDTSMQRVGARESGWMNEWFRRVVFHDEWTKYIALFVQGKKLLCRPLSTDCFAGHLNSQ